MSLVTTSTLEINVMNVRHLGGEENASRVRQLWRGGWVGVPIGAAMIAAECFLGSGL